MQTIFDIIFLFLLLGSVWANFFFIFMLKNVKAMLLDMEIKNVKLHDDLVNMDNKYDKMFCQMQKAVSDISKSVSDTNYLLTKANEEKNAKINNWDNIKQAFNRPSRNELNGAA